MIASKVKPKMIIAGASSYSRDMNFKKFRTIADKVGAFLMADIAHPAGLIACGLLSDPLPHCHVVTTTTHKTLRGPRGGLILMGKDFENPFGIKLKNGSLRKMSHLINMSVFPGNQGGPLEHVIAAKAIAFGEALEPKFKDYMQRVRLNASLMADLFIQRGYDVVSGGTDNHMILIDLRNKKITGKEAEEILARADITVNKNMVPFDDKSPFVTSGIRIGTAAITTRGVNENNIEKVVHFIDSVLTNHLDKSIVERISSEVHEMMSPFPLYV